MNHLLPSHAFSCFVTGTDTEIGKTLVASALVYLQAQRGHLVAAMKPIAAGTEWLNGRWCNEDVDTLAASASVALPQQITTPYLFKAAAAPHIAASLENVLIDRLHILSCFEQARAQSEAVVVGMRLGCINQALLTFEAIAKRGLKLMGWVANRVDERMLYPQENIEAIAQRIDAPLLGTVPRLSVASAAAAAASFQ